MTIAQMISNWWPSYKLCICLSQKNWRTWCLNQMTCFAWWSLQISLYGGWNKRMKMWWKVIFAKLALCIKTCIIILHLCLYHGEKSRSKVWHTGCMKLPFMSKSDVADPFLFPKLWANFWQQQQPKLLAAQTIQKWPTKTTLDMSNYYIVEYNREQCNAFQTYDISHNFTMKSIESI